MLLRIQVFAAIGAVVAIILFQISNALDTPYAADKFRVQQLMDRRHQVEALAIGNSHSRAIDFEALGLNGYHVWQGGNDVFETQHQVRVLTPKLSNLKLVFFAISYFTFRYDNAANPEVDKSDLRRSYYAAMPSLAYIDGDLRNYLLALCSPIIRRDHWRGVFAAIAQKSGVEPALSPNERFGIDRWGRPIDTQDSTFMTQDSLLRHTEEIGVPSNLRRVKAMSANHPGLVKDTYRTVVETIRYLQKRGVRVICFTPPYFKLYSGLYDLKIRAEQRELMQELQTQTHAEYYDFSEDPAFVSDHTLFRDDDHLNIWGAKLFSEKLRQIIFRKRRDP